MIWDTAISTAKIKVTLSNICLTNKGITHVLSGQGHNIIRKHAEKAAMCWDILISHIIILGLSCASNV
jgi:hypothetical protein